MHRVKGLAFLHVLIAGVNDGFVPYEGTYSPLDPELAAESELRERCLLHVASSRARETVTITSCGVPSRFIEVFQE